MWVKWHHKFSYGSDSEIFWNDLGSFKTREEAEEAAESWCLEIRDEFNWSEHYRGVDYELHELPPVDILQKKLKSAEGCVRLWRKNIKYLQNLLLEAQKQENEKQSS